MVRKFFGNWWPTMIVVAAILYATLNSDPVGADDLPQIPHLDKLIHAIMFGGLFSAIMFDRMRSHCSDSLAIRIMIAAVCVVCGAVDEIAQNAADNGRSGDIYDFYADIAGIIVAFFAAPPAIRAVLRKAKNSEP